MRLARGENVTGRRGSGHMPASMGRTLMAHAEFDDAAFLARLRDGDGAAYRTLIRRFHPSLVSVANSVIGSRAQAEEVVQDAWLAVFNGIGRFEGRSSLATWLFSIVLNRARTRISREARLVGLPGILDGAQGRERAVDTSEFKPDGHWIEVPRLWEELDPERVVGGRQLWALVQEAIEHLPAGQRAVIVLRDMEGRAADETCELLGISAENQRVLLHRARGRIRKTIDAVVAGGTPQAAVARVAPGSAARPVPRRGGGNVIARAFLWARALRHASAALAYQLQ
jgi:RNA polymerase sigma-70 factor, ECF subfamily